MTFILPRSNVATGPRRKRKTGQRRLAARATTTKVVGYRKGSEKETLIRSPTTLTHLQWRISMQIAAIKEGILPGSMIGHRRTISTRTMRV